MPTKTESKGEVKNVDAKGTKEEGTIWVSSSGSYYTEPEIDAIKLRNLRDNVYGRGLAMKMRNLIFRDKYTLEVLDAKGEPDEDRRKAMTTMCDSKGVRMWANMQRAYMDIVWYGIGLQNDVWGYEDNEYRLLKLRHLPAYTFGDAVTEGEQKIYSQILQGITLDEHGDMAFYQTDEDDIQTQIKNVFYIKDPVADGIAGESIILPVVPIMEMLKFTWNTQMQQANRTGAKILFVKVLDPQPASGKNGGVGDVEYANELLQKWSKDQAFQIRENMEIIDPHIKDDSNNLEIIAALEHMIIDYITPTAMIARDGNSIGGSETQREELLNKYIEGIHNWLEDQYEMLLNKYLEYNQYVDYSVHIHIPAPSIDRSKLEREEAKTGFETRSLFPNEIRKRLHAEDLDDEKLKELEDFYSQIQPAQQPGKFEQEVMETAEEKKIKKETPDKVERSIEEALEDAAEKLCDNIIKAIEEEEK